MKKSLFTMALVAAGAVIYLLSKDKEEEKSETPEIKLIDLKKEHDEPDSYNDSTEDPQEEKEETVPMEEDKTEAEVKPEVIEEVVLKEEETVSDLMTEPKAEELHNELNSEETIVEENFEPVEEVQESVTEEEVQEITEEPVEDESEAEAVQEENESLLPVEEETVEVTESPAEEVKIEDQVTNMQEEEPVQEENLIVPDYFEELNVAEMEAEESEDTESADKDLQGKILNEVEQEIKDNNDFSDFVRGNQQKDEELRYSGTVYEVSDLYPYLSYEMIDKILDANIGFNHVYHDNQPIKIVHRVGFDKIEDLIEFVILIKEHDYRVEENNGLDMISISKELVVEDTIIISDIFNVSNQVYRLHGHYQGYEIIEQ